MNEELPFKYATAEDFTNLMAESGRELWKMMEPTRPETIRLLQSCLPELTNPTDEELSLFVSASLAASLKERAAYMEELMFRAFMRTRGGEMEDKS